MDARSTQTSARAYLYDAAGADREVPVGAGLIAQAGADALVWIDLPERRTDAIAAIGDILDLAPRAQAMLTDRAARHTVTNFGHYQLFSVLPVPAKQDDPSPAEASRLDFVVGENWLLTVHDGEIGFLAAFRDQDQAETRTGVLSGQAFAASLLDWLFEGYFLAVAAIETEIEKLDERILAENAGKDMLSQIVDVQRRVSQLRRRLSCHRQVVYGLVRPDLAVQDSADETRPYERLGPRFERALDEVERARDLIVVSYDLLNSRLGQSTNDLVRALTFFTVLIGGIAALAGLLGMNFELALFRTGLTGFLSVTGLLGIVSLAALVWARRRDWI